MHAPHPPPSGLPYRTESPSSPNGRGLAPPSMPCGIPQRPGVRKRDAGGIGASSSEAGAVPLNTAVRSRRTTWRGLLDRAALVAAGAMPGDPEGANSMQRAPRSTSVCGTNSPHPRTRRSFPTRPAPWRSSPERLPRIHGSRMHSNETGSHCPAVRRGGGFPIRWRNSATSDAGEREPAGGVVRRGRFWTRALQRKAKSHESDAIPSLGRTFEPA